MWGEVFGWIRQQCIAAFRRVVDAARRSKRWLLHPVGLAVAGLGLAAFLLPRFVTGIAPGEAGVRVNRLTGSVAVLPEGWSLAIPGVTRLVRFPLREQVFHIGAATGATGRNAFQSTEGLTLGADITVRYALDA